MTFYDTLTERTADNRNALYKSEVFSAVEKGQFTAKSYQYFLTQAYHHVKHTVPLLMQCGASLPAEYEWLRKAMVEYIDEEYGHDEWILNDIEAMGENRERAKTSTPDENIELMVAYLYDGINRIHPVALLGMVFMLESTSTQVATGMATKIRNQISADGAFSYLLSHGELDLKHIEFFKKLVNQIDNPEHQEIIIKSANMCYRLYANMLGNIPDLTQSSRDAKHEAA